MNEEADIELTCPHCGEAISLSMVTPAEERCVEKVPRAGSAGAPAVRRDRLSLLRDEMKEAVKAENYELAAQIRDQIKDLEEKTEKEKDA